MLRSGKVLFNPVIIPTYTSLLSRLKFSVWPAASRVLGGKEYPINPSFDVLADVSDVKAFEWSTLVVAERVKLGVCARACT